MTVQTMDWDLSSYFSSFNGEDMTSFKDRLKDDIAGVQQTASTLDDLNNQNLSAWESVILDFEDLITRLRHISSYIGCLTSADAHNEAYSMEEGAVSVLSAEMTKIHVDIHRALKTVSDEVFNSFTDRPLLKDTGYYLSRIKRQAQYTMSPCEEVLTADLGVNGIEAWGRLYDSISGKLEFEMTYPDGRTERLSMSRRRSLMEHSDRRIRIAAFEAGNAAWAQVESVPEAALNAIGGTRLTLNKYRGVDHFLDIALFQAGITRETLDAMFDAIYSEIDVARNILKSKAGHMNQDRLAWFDFSAPMPAKDQANVSWEEGKSLVKKAFGQSYPDLATYVQSVYDKSWIDWSPRAGKRPGAFCTGSPLSKESRVYMTYNDTMGDVLTLAHELGHAFHGHTMGSARTLARSYPMTLAESASTFGEMLLMRGLLDEPAISNELKAFILNLEISHAAVYLLDIPVRFEFEKAFYEERAEGEVVVSRLKELMVETQRRVVGDVLEDGGEDPYFWASKLHFYITGVTFYNFPYTFGFLLSRGLFSQFLKQGPTFLPKYESFLQRSGNDTVENVVAQCLGVDLTQPDFWVEAIHSLKEPHRRLEQLMPQINKTV